MELAVDLAVDPDPAVDLVALAGRVTPLTLARERTLPIGEEFAPMFVNGLERGRTLACQGPAATSTALALVAPTLAAGAWMALIDVPAIGLDAANELGVPLERIVGVRSGADRADSGDDRGRRWADVVAAAADGFDVVMVRVPGNLHVGVARKLAVRLRRREVVTVVLGDPGQFACDGTLHTGAPAWSGLGDGHGHLRQRHVDVEATGRRLPGRRRCALVMPREPLGSHACAG